MCRWGWPKSILSVAIVHIKYIYITFRQAGTSIQLQWVYPGRRVAGQTLEWTWSKSSVRESTLHFSQICFGGKNVWKRGKSPSLFTFVLFRARCAKSNHSPGPLNVRTVECRRAKSSNFLTLMAGRTELPFIYFVVFYLQNYFLSVSLVEWASSWSYICNPFSINNKSTIATLPLTLRNNKVVYILTANVAIN